MKRQTCLFIPAAHHEFDHLVSVQRVLVLHNAQGGEAPIYGVHTEVRSEMICEIVLVLQTRWFSFRVQCTHDRSYLSEGLDILHVQRYTELIIRHVRDVLGLVWLLDLYNE
jgi:hypothetical protein